ncbi:hypothetical protein ATANTOWER_016434 [Ataeniobius toweri]|uniref:Uncharacterized protein n=1 Tax=Ataeniobius toweri TaxID=208326 RepID=A0ABU7CBB3_9TELE|nr:hypothetical protein [Ataeniobius toweri]
MIPSLNRHLNVVQGFVCSNGPPSLEDVFQLQGDRTPQPPWKGLRQGVGEESPANSRTSAAGGAVWFFVPAVEHWTSSTPSTGCSRVHMTWSCWPPLAKIYKMRIISSKSEAMVLDRKRVACPL